MVFTQKFILIITHDYTKNNITMTTKKDFIAAITDKNERKTVAKNFCEIFSEQNQRFDENKFLKACNVQN